MFKFETNNKYDVEYLLYCKFGSVLSLIDYSNIEGVSFSSIHETIKRVSTLLSSSCSVSINSNEITIETKNSLEIFRIMVQ